MFSDASLLSIADQYIYRTRTGTSIRTRFEFKSVFVAYTKTMDTQKPSLYFLSGGKLSQLFLLKEVKPIPDRKMITCFRHYDILATTRSRMTTAIAFSR